MSTMAGSLSSCACMGKLGTHTDKERGAYAWVVDGDCRAWQLFDWVRALPEGHALRRLCDADTYTTMITLCGPWQQLRRALQLVAEMRARSLECGAQVRHSTQFHPLHSPLHAVNLR